MEAVEATEDILPRAKLRYATGVGVPAELPEYVARGVDLMDCVLRSRNARNGYLFTSEGRVIIIAEGAQFRRRTATHCQAGQPLRYTMRPAGMGQRTPTVAPRQFVRACIRRFASLGYRPL